MASFFRLNDVDSNIVAFRSDPFTTAIKLREFRAHLPAAASTSEDLTVTIESAISADYDTVIYRLDLSTASTVDISNTGRSDQIVPGDRLRIDYPNTDGVTMAWQLFLSPDT